MVPDPHYAPFITKLFQIAARRTSRAHGRDIPSNMEGEEQQR
jgi:hypothetical protein